MRRLTGILAFILSVNIAWSQATIEESLRTGNNYYNSREYDKAAVEYNKVLAQDANHTVAKFNLANTLVKQNKLSEANKLFNDVATNTSTENQVSGSAFYNKGVVLTGQKRLEESIEAYKSALRKNPEDEEARDNLQKALQELKKKEPPKQQQQKQNQNKQEQQKKQQQPKMSQREAEQRLDLLEQKEKEVQERLQKEKSKSGGGQGKDW